MWPHARILRQTRFRTEAETGSALIRYTGRVIPRCYAFVQVMPLPADCRVPEATVYGLILEDLGGMDVTKF